MHIESFREYCLTKKGVSESSPFGENTLVFKVMDKMFALTDIDNFTSINLKCEPERAMELREKFPSILPGYHMNKRHWNTVLMDGLLSEELVRELIDHSYDLVVAKLPLASRNFLRDN